MRQRSTPIVCDSLYAGMQIYSTEFLGTGGGAGLVEGRKVREGWNTEPAASCTPVRVTGSAVMREAASISRVATRETTLAPRASSDRGRSGRCPARALPLSPL